MHLHHQRLQQMYRNAPIIKALFPESAITISEGKAIVTLPLKEAYHHAAGAMHGAVYFKMLDNAAYFAANSLVPDAFLLTTQYQTDFKRPVSKGVIKAIGQAKWMDDRTLQATAELFDDNGDLIATGQGFFVKSKFPLDKTIGYH